MELEAAGKELVRRVSVAAQRLDERGGRPLDDMEILLAEVKSHLDPSSPTGKDLLEIVGIDMPSILVKFAIIPHGSCAGIADLILKTLLESCDPRDMFAAYMEALHLYSEPETLALCPIILDGLPKIFTRLRRRRIEYFKESLPGLLRVAGLTMDTNRETSMVLDKFVQIVTVLLDIDALVEVKEQRQRLHEAVGVFILLLLVRFSEFEQLSDSDAVQSLLMQLAKLIPTSGLTYLDMITGSPFECFIDSISGDLVNKGGYSLDTRQGAALAVWWRFCFGETAIGNQEVVQKVVIFSPQSKTRQRAYNILVNIVRKVLSPIERFKALKQLIIECEHSSMVSLLIYVVKEEADKALTSKSTVEGTRSPLNSPFASDQVLELVDFVLRPPVGGPPDLPNQIDAVLSVLNLYRFLLIKETTGKSNYTGVLFKERLEEACSKWLQPLRSVIEGFKRDWSADDSEATANVLLSISNLEGVLYRCLELAEAALKEDSC